MRVSRRRLAAHLGVALAAALIVVASAQLWLPLVGRALVQAGPPRKADIAVVPAGDFRGKRILEAAQLVREGFVPRVLVSGPGGNYGAHECDLAIPFAVKEGYPERYFAHAPNDARSTREEAGWMAAELGRLGVKSYILVTSDYHTRRAGAMFRDASPRMKVYVVAAPNAEFDLRTWWQQREGRKAVAAEWAKTLTGPFGI